MMMHAWLVGAAVSCCQAAATFGWVSEGPGVCIQYPAAPTATCDFFTKHCLAAAAVVNEKPGFAKMSLPYVFGK
jgi:hypothetical protein